MPAQIKRKEVNVENLLFQFLVCYNKNNMRITIRQWQKAQTKKAFTLVELLLASAILVVTLSGLAALFSYILVLNETNRNKYSALNHAEFVMEEIKNTTFSGIVTAIQNGNWDWNSSAISSHGLVALTGEQIDTSVSGTTILDVTTVVSWQDTGGRQRSLTVTTKMVSS